MSLDNGGRTMTLAQFDTLLVSSSPQPNILINGNFDVWQESGTASLTYNTSTAKYVADIWFWQSDTNGNWTAIQSTDAPIGSLYSCKFVNATQNKQMLVGQFVENAEAAKYAGKYVSVSFKAKTTTAKEISNLRCAVLSYTGTADQALSSTNKPVTTWAGNGTNPTWTTGWTMENSPVNLALTTSWQTFNVGNVYLDTSGLKNIAVVIWTDDTTISQNDEFYVGQVKLEDSAVCTPYVPVSVKEEEDKVMMFVRKYTYDSTTQNTQLPLLCAYPGPAAVYMSATFAMRGPATIILGGTRGTDYCTYSGSTSNTSGTLSIRQQRLGRLYIPNLVYSGGSFTENAPFTMFLTTSSGYLLADARL